MFRIPPVTKNLLIINLIAFIATFVFQLRGIDLADIGGLHFFLASNFHFYQLVTYLFLHASFMHILSNMFGLWMFGCVIENVWGPKKFLFYYITCGIGAGLLQEIAQLGSFYMNIIEQVPGASFGSVLAYGAQYASVRIYPLLHRIPCMFSEGFFSAFPTSYSSASPLPPSVGASS